MKTPSQKLPEEIQIQVLRSEIEDGLTAPGKVSSEVSLKEKMDDYLMRLGYSNASVWAIALQLLTKGKVQVDFRHYNERLKLIDPADTLTPPAAVFLLEIYFRSSRSNVKESEEDVTRKFTVQPPKTARFGKNSQS
jgi:hypothetical protein